MTGRETVTRDCRRAIIALSCCTLVTPACLSKSWAECSSGVLCPETRVCAEPLGQCVTHTLVDACAGKSEGDACSAAGSLAELRGVAILDEQHAFATGAAGTVLELTGGEWREIPSFTGANLNRAWTDGTAVVVSGDSFTVVRFDGSSWDTQTRLVAGSGSFEDVWGFSATDIWVTGDDGAVIHTSDGGDSWRPVDTTIDGTVTGVWGASDDEVFMVTDVAKFLRCTADDVCHVSDILDADGEPIEEIQALWGTASNDLYAVGEGIAVHFNGDVWSEMELPPGLDAVELTSISGNADGSVIWAVGSLGTSLRYEQGEWKQVPSGTDNNLVGVAVGSNTALIVGTGGTILELDNGEWRSFKSQGICQSGACLPPQ
jgi:photosystem II stability/assembly factor-like uncharacterized protein